MFALTGCGVRYCMIILLNMPIVAMPLGAREAELLSETA